MPIKNDDFRCMWRGQVVRCPSLDEITLLSDFHHETGAKHRALLLLHGFSSSPAVFRNMLPTLTQAYDTVHCPILPGHGACIDDFEQVQAQDWRLTAEACCEALLKDYEQVDVMGLSLGGLLACHLAARYPLNHAYLLAPALALQIPLSATILLTHILRRLGFRYLRNQSGNIYIKAHCEITYRKLPLSTLSEILTLIESFKLNSAQCALDVFLGRFDEVVDSGKVEALFKASEEKTNIHWLNNSAHILSLDGNVDEILAVILANLKRASLAPA